MDNALSSLEELLKLDKFKAWSTAVQSRVWIVRLSEVSECGSEEN